MIRRTLPIHAALLLAGCATAPSGGFPSLAPRAAEREGFEEPAAPPPQVARPDPALDARIAGLAAAADAGARFGRARATAEARVAAAAGTPTGSDRWLDAQVALGDLDVLRAEASERVTALEQLAADRAVAGEPPYPALDAARAEAQARFAEIAGAIAELNARLSR